MAVLHLIPRIQSHPGTLLKQEISARNLSAHRLALSLGVPAGRILEIVHGRRGITPDTAIRLEVERGK